MERARSGERGKRKEENQKIYSVASPVPPGAPDVAGVVPPVASTVIWPWTRERARKRSKSNILKLAKEISCEKL